MESTNAFRTPNTASATTAGSEKHFKIIFRKTSAFTTLKQKGVNCTKPTVTAALTSSGVNRANRKKPDGHPSETSRRKNY